MNCGDDVWEAYPLFQAGSGGSIPTSPLQFTIEPIGHYWAKKFVEKWHYSKRMPTGKNICYQLGNSKEVYAVIVYGIGVNPYQAKSLGVSSCLEIKRMCRTEPKQKYELSRFISITIKMVTKEHNVDAIVAFADPEQGHEGIVYKASGFKHEGKTNPEWHLIDKDGNKRHRRLAFRYARRKNITIEQAREELGMERSITLPKHRWVRYINNRRG